jgi:hypothetical protein
MGAGDFHRPRFLFKPGRAHAPGGGSPPQTRQGELLAERSLAGVTGPEAVREVMIPKPGGKGMRKLGIPTVVDRLIQQALHQVLSPIFDPFFSDYSYGYRAGRSAHQAVLQAREYVTSGRRWVVDMDPAAKSEAVGGSLGSEAPSWLCARVRWVLACSDSPRAASCMSERRCGTRGEHPSRPRLVGE